MPMFWPQIVLIPLLVLIIPIAILIGQRWRGGPLVSLSAGATLCLLIYLALLWSSLSSTDLPIGIFSSLPGGILFVSCALLLLGACALTFADALRARRLVLAVIQCALVYGSFVGLMGFTLAPLQVCGDALPPTCGPPDLGRFAFFAALGLAGPVALLVYALRAGSQRQPRALPEGLTISRLTTEEG